MHQKSEDLTFDLRRMLKKHGVKYSNLKIINDRINFKLNDANLANNLIKDIKELSQSSSQNAVSSQTKSN